MKKHGGHRKGSGRPATVQAAQNLNIRISAADMAKIERLAVAWKCSKSDAVRTAIRDAKP